MSFWRNTETRGEKINRWVAELRRVAGEAREDKLSQPEILTALAIALGIEAGAMFHVEKPSSTLDEMLGPILDGVRGAAHDAVYQLTGSMPLAYPSDPKELTNDEFNQLTHKIIQTATENTTTWDSVTVTAKALGTQIAVLSRRPDASLEQLITQSQQAVAAFAYEGRVRLEAQST